SESPDLGLLQPEEFAVRDGINATVIAELVERLQDSSQLVRVCAATLLGSLGAGAAPAVPALIHMLKTGTPADRKLAVLMLGEIGSEARLAIPALADAARDEDGDLADLATDALDRVDIAELPDVAA